MDWVWSIVAGVCLVVSAILLLRGNVDATFVIATLGVLAWFIGLRQRLRKLTPVAPAHEPEEKHDASGDKDED